MALSVLVCAGLSTAIIGLSAGEDQDRPEKRASETWRTLIGSWHVTSGQKSLVISIEPGGEALVLLIQPGQHSIDRVPWEPFHGGVLVHDVPRKRLWLGRHDQELRAEIEPIPELGYDPDREFHQRFFMRRVPDRTLPVGWREREVPANWLHETVEEGWDAKAGKRLENRND